MVAGSRLNMDWNIRLPLPILRSADTMNAFGEYSLSPPRGPDCCVSTIKAWPMSIKFHEPTRGMNMGMGQDCGFKLVPEAMFIKNIPAAFICIPRFMPGISVDFCSWLSWGKSSHRCYRRPGRTRPKRALTEIGSTRLPAGAT